MGHCKSISIVAGSILAALISGAASSADVNEVRVTFDPGFTDRTNMGRAAGDSSVIGVGVDAGLQSRTNMPERDPKEDGVLTANPDVGLRERTNMGGIARDSAQPEGADTAAVAR
jgi:hypothetical protein